MVDQKAEHSAEQCDNELERTIEHRIRDRTCVPHRDVLRGASAVLLKVLIPYNSSTQIRKTRKIPVVMETVSVLPTMSSLRQAASLTMTGELEKQPIPVLYQSAIPHRPSQHFLRASSIFNFSWLRPSACPSSVLLSKARMQTHRSCLWYTDGFLLGLQCPRKLCKCSQGLVLKSFFFSLQILHANEWLSFANHLQ